MRWQGGWIGTGGALLLCLLAVSAAARTLSEVRGPAEAPPVGYEAREYVDSAGCVFLRAGVDGRTVWVPRVNRDRTLLCGRTPSLPAGGTPPVPNARVAARPAEPAAVPDAAPRRLSSEEIRRRDRSLLGLPVPEGYEPAFRDDRLNPARGPEAGQGGAMARLWSETVPRQLAEPSLPDRGPQGLPPPGADPDPDAVTEAEARAVPSPPAPDPAPLPPPLRRRETADRFVQIGTYERDDTARRIVQDLGATGLPAVLRLWRSGGRNYRVVLAGPFAGEEELTLALEAVRARGFADAFIRR
ncbi:SPOR domain-containing protein [Pseudooceanicola sp. CBS1P-1]|uniref:SPOR domain-containing protein n=1 Tax=Pseudooceanicola albus TaxID=2692189 RepID=A0A6L7G125_9RHOB|nr:MULTISPECIES: SPOR domain-containing protein [Pseudooceanicola]MBT9382605.1 SPOR domain-containing protein [Pseudooceanicola endophyticus]MXN17146.1 hypothetical protein [Pseudooceanicola albus]